MDPRIEGLLTAFISGFQRSVSDAKEAGVMPVDEGKQPVTFQQYQYFAKLTLVKCKNHVLNHTHLLMQFSGMSRNKSISVLAYSHFFLSNDCIAFKHSRHKG